MRPRQLTTTWFRRSSSARVERFATTADPRPRIRDKAAVRFPLGKNHLPSSTRPHLSVRRKCGGVPCQADRAAVIPWALGGRGGTPGART